MDVLVAMGSGISFLWSLYIFYRMTWLITNGVANMNIMPLYHDQLYFESAAMIPALITVGKLLEALSKGRTTDALKSLMRMAPKEALLLRNGEEIRGQSRGYLFGEAGRSGSCRWRDPVGNGSA